MEGEIILESIFWAASNIPGIVFSSVQSLSRVRLFATPWTTARQASLSITNSCSPSKPMSIESVMPSNYLILCCPLLLLPSIFPSIRVFSDESALRIRWPKYWSFSVNISPTKGWSPLGWTGGIVLGACIPSVSKADQYPCLWGACILTHW